MNAYFLQCQFDEQGLWDANEKDRTMRGAVEAGSAVPKGAYRQELYKAKHIDPFRWNPTSELVERLRHGMDKERNMSETPEIILVEEPS